MQILKLALELVGRSLSRIDEVADEPLPGLATFDRASQWLPTTPERVDS